MPYGLTCAPAVFQRLMTKILHGLPTEYVFWYINDILIVMPTFELHMKVLQMVLDHLRQFNMILKPSKCKFLGAEMSYLGYIISHHGLAPEPDVTNSMGASGHLKAAVTAESQQQCSLRFQALHTVIQSGSPLERGFLTLKLGLCWSCETCSNAYL